MKFKQNNRSPFDPEDAKRIKLAVGILALILAACNLFFPDPTSLSTGRWSWIYRNITAAFGPYGYPAFQALVGLACIAASRHKSNKDMSNRDKQPGTGRN